MLNHVKPFIIAVTVFVLMLQHSAQAQLVEDFDDGDLANPIIWLFAPSAWQTNAGRLQSASHDTNGVFYISTPVAVQAGQQWQLAVELDFNPSSFNYVDIYLQADSADVTKPTCSGYFVRLGNAQDEVCLYRKNENNTVVKVIDGRDNVLNRVNNRVYIKVTRKADYTWTLLWQDFTSTEPEWVMEGRAIDSTYKVGNFFGVAIHQSTSGFFGKHFFDDIVLSPYVPDITPPFVKDVRVNQAQQIVLSFSEALDRAVVKKQNFILTPAIPIDTFIFINNSTIILQTSAALISKAFYQLALNNIADVDGNVLSHYAQPIAWSNSEAYDVIVTEVMPDIEPVVGLPAAEYIEIHNRTAFGFVLDGWKLKVGSTIISLKNSIDAYGYIVVCSQFNASLFSNTIRVMGVPSFPSLNNASDTIMLYNASGKLIHSMYYNSGMYENAVKQAGGWSLELKDTAQCCIVEGNWVSSRHRQGGTPGRLNSVYQSNITFDALKVLRCVALSPTQLQINFNHAVDSASAAQLTNYVVGENGYTITGVKVLAPFYQAVILQLSTALQASAIITLKVAGIKRCDGVVMSSQSIQTGLAVAAQASDVVMNEILFNPKPGGVDFIELYNTSNNIIDCSELLISNSVQLGSVLYRIAKQPLLLFPGEYIVCTEDKNALLKQYLVKNPEQVIQCSTLPSMPDDAGVVILSNQQGTVIDSLTYSTKWHFALLHDAEGVSLERMQFKGNTNDASNWHSAASTVGFATPTYVNSQLAEAANLTSRFRVVPKTFSPNQDGFEDYASIYYAMEQLGAVATITVFDMQGRMVKSIARNATLGNSGQFKWDGTTDSFTQAPQGVYIIYCDVFALNGRRWKEKLTVVVAQRE